MPFRRMDAEAFRETIEELRGECNFRHQDQRLPPAPDVFSNGLEIHFRFSRACDAIKQRDGIATLRDRRSQRVGGGELGERKFRFTEIGIRPRSNRLWSKYD